MPDALSPSTATHLDQLIASAAESVIRPPLPDISQARIGLIGSEEAVTVVARRLCAANLDARAHIIEAGEPAASAQQTGLADSIDDIKDCHFVIDLTEALFNGKKQLLAAMSNAPAATLLMTSTAIRSVQSLAANGDQTSRWLGATIGPFWHGRQLLEIKTNALSLNSAINPDTDRSAQTVATAYALADALGVAAIVVADADQDFCWRMQTSYLYEAMAMLGEAVDPALIERTALELGMRAGPFSELDRISLELIDHVLHAELHALEHEDHDHGHGHGHGHGQHDGGAHHHHSHTVKSRQMPESAVYVMEKMAHGFNRLGRAAGAGFYDYDYDDEEPELWEGLAAFARGANKADPGDCADRLLMAPAIAAMHCILEGKVSGLASANLGAVLGGGYSAALGGPVEWARSLGYDNFMRQAHELAARYGERFTPPADCRQLFQ